jgi:mannose-6-phosphate isomerase-like protein (cupin superfamily)
MSLMKSLKHVKSCWVGRSRTTDKPWGSEVVWAAHHSVGGKILHIRESERTSLKFNTLKDECLFVLSGIVEVQYGNQETLTDPVQHPFEHTVLSPGESLCVQSGCPYRITAVEDSQVIEISEERFNSRSIRIEDDYGRK